jgi:acyl carrier protein phosphodiesterase
MVDMFYDHFLARYWQEYSDVPLADFARRAYALLLHEEAPLPAEMRRVVGRMAEQDWLTSYGDPVAIALALDRVSRRLRRTNTLSGAAAELTLNYAALEADFRRFLPDVVTFVASNMSQPDLPSAA